MATQENWKYTSPLTEEEKNKQDYPSVDLAYDIAVQSYDWAHKRWEAVDNRIQTFLTFAITVELALPVIIHNNFPQTKFRSFWFIFACVAYIASTLVGFFARLKKGLELLNPRKIYLEYLDFSEWEFKLNIIYWAGVDFEAHRDRLNYKVKYAVAMLLLFMIGNGLLIFWINGAI